MKRIKEILAITMIGEGFFTLIYPHWHLLLWRVGPQAYRDAVTALIKRPGFTRLVAILESCFGFWLAKRQVTG